MREQGLSHDRYLHMLSVPRFPFCHGLETLSANGLASDCHEANIPRDGRERLMCAHGLSLPSQDSWHVGD